MAKKQKLKSAKLVRYHENVNLLKNKLIGFGISKKTALKQARKQVGKDTREYRKIMRQTKNYKNDPKMELKRLKAIRDFKRVEITWGRETKQEIDSIVLES